MFFTAFKMDNTLGFDENKGSVSELGWHAGISSLEDIDESESHSLQRLLHQNIEVIPQKKIHTDRPIIPATMMEKLSFYRAFTSSSSKIEMLCMQQNNVNRFIWFYVSNALCKSLPMTYVYIFLSAYAPDHHLFVPKMVPISYGISWINVLCARFLLQTNSYNIGDHIHYALSGLLFRAPWNRCVNRKIDLIISNISYTCVELEEFTKLFVNNIILFSNGFYVKPTGELFTLSHLHYFDWILMPCTDSLRQSCLMLFILISVWIITAAVSKQLFKKYIWKLLLYTQLVLIVLLSLIFCHLVVSHEDRTIQVIKSAREVEEQRKILMTGDFDMLAESMTAPPVAHILSSRTTTEIKPSLNSAVIVVSNGVYYIFKGLTSYLMKRYCERWVNATILYWNYGSGSKFYFWPLYFDTIPYGPVLAVIFFTLSAIEEYCMFVISFQCLIEMIQYEWLWLKSWLAKSILVILAVTESILMLTYEISELSENSFILYMSLSSLAEILIIFWVYPLNRFLDDITFHFGVTPTRLRKWSFIILPPFYMIKVFTMLYKFYRFHDTDNLYNVINESFYAPSCIITLLSFGAAYAIYDNVFRRKRNFSQLFKPVPEWGPKDYNLRQLRKMFDNRDYILSQAPRDLSRYLINKSELESYKLDIVYEPSEIRSTLHVDDKDEKKKY